LGTLSLASMLPNCQRRQRVGRAGSPVRCPESQLPSSRHRRHPRDLRSGLFAPSPAAALDLRAGDRADGRAAANRHGRPRPLVDRPPRGPATGARQTRHPGDPRAPSTPLSDSRAFTSTSDRSRPTRLAYALPEWRRSRIPVSRQRLAFLARFCSIRGAESSVAGRRGSSPRSTGAKSWRCSRWPTRKPAACSRPCPRRHTGSAGGSSFPTAPCFPATAAGALLFWPRSG
jgi:hypothetical protein